MSDVGHLTEVGPAAPATGAAPAEGSTAARVSRWARLGHMILTAERFALGATLGLWICDAILLAFIRGGATWTQWAHGMGAAAFVALSTALVLGAVVGPALVAALSPYTERAGAAWAALRRGELQARHTLIAGVLALPLVIAVWAEVSYNVGQAIVFGFARPDTMAAAMTVANMAFTVALVVAWQAVVRAMRWLVDGMAGVRGLRWLVQRAWRVPALVGSALVITLSVVLWILRKQLIPLPWLELAPLVGVLLGAAVAAYLPRAPVWLRRGAIGLTALVFAGGFVAGLRLRPESSKAQSIGFDRALSGRAGYEAWVLAMDFDRDGQISMLGGGDCAPFDSRRYTGAPDLPNNGVDEDCDGSDLSPQALRFRPALNIKPGTLPDKPTVIFVTVDALAGPELTAIGGKKPVMPRLDELASRSMLFTHCFAQGPSTRMSFPSILTSRWDSQLMFEYSSRMPYSWSDKERTLQDTFDDAGYETDAVIPNVYFDQSRWVSVTRGFQNVDAAALHAATGKHDAREVTDEALRIMSAQRDKPLYLWVHYFDAHPPYGPPPGVTPPDKDDRTYYTEELQYIDQQLGRIIDAVDARTEPVYLVLTSDHATSFHPVPESRHFHYGYDIYTSTLHVPLIFHGPGIKPGRNDHVVATMDVAPTIANLFNLNTKGRFEGTSLAPELLNGTSDADRMTFHEFYLPENLFRGHGDPLEFVSLRTDKLDLVLNRKHGTYELYDWIADYWEMNDLYEERARTPEVAHLRSLLGAFILRYDSASMSLPSPATRPGSSRSGYPAVEN
jgi:choline-sulfatase